MTDERAVSPPFGTVLVILNEFFCIFLLLCAHVTALKVGGASGRARSCAVQCVGCIRRSPVQAAHYELNFSFLLNSDI